jgi:hypothetical protein
MFPISIRHRWIILSVACCTLAAVGSSLYAKDAPKKDAQEDAMEVMMKAGKPGEQHESLKKCAGSWKAVVKSWNGPGDPVISEGTADFKMILGDRYLEQRFTGSMMNMPYEGYGLTGYDNMKKTYTMMWIDNMGTSMMTGIGSYDAAKKTMTFKSSGLGPDGKMMNFRMTNVMTDDNTQLFTMYNTEKGKEMKMMEITYTRAS